MSFYICNIPTLTSASSFATGRGSPYCFRCRPASTHFTMARRPLSLILGMRDNRSYPQAHYSIPRLFSLPNSRLKHCRDLIFFRLRGAQIYIGGWLQVSNPLKTPQIHPSQSGILLHGRANTSCAPRTDNFAISKRPCSIVHGEGWNFYEPYQLALVARARIERTSCDFQSPTHPSMSSSHYINSHSLSE